MQNKVKLVWEKVTERIKHEIIRPTLWRSLETAVPIAVENNEFVVGFTSGSFHMSGNLTASENKIAIEKAFRELTGVPLTLRVIQGDTLEDWKHAKSKDESLETLRQAERAKREKVRSVTQSWDGLMERLGRTYAATPMRQFPQSRAAYVREAVVMISEAMDELMDEDELTQRSLARAIDKAGQLAEVPGPIIALELFRFRENK
ncbi:MAG: hypothetical protein ACYC2Y_04990 [Armatimonadota bacterium]